MNARLSRKEEELVMSLHRKKHNYPCLQLHSGSRKKVSMVLLLQLQIRSLTQGFFAPPWKGRQSANCANHCYALHSSLLCWLNPRKLQNDTETLSSQQLCYYSFCRVFRIARSCIIKSRAQHNFPVTIVWIAALKLSMMNCVVFDKLVLGYRMFDELIMY